MNHEYRASPYSPGVCAGCGLSWSLCQGMKPSPPVPSFLRQLDAETSLWDAWCRRFGIDPNTSDETVFDDYLHGRTPPLYPTPRLPFPVVPLSAVARAEVYELERWFRL